MSFYKYPKRILYTDLFFLVGEHQDQVNEACYYLSLEGK